jgi:hypothetical protein
LTANSGKIANFFAQANRQIPGELAALPKVFITFLHFSVDIT